MNNTRRQPGAFVISLDFELMWGMFDKVDNESYGKNLDGVWFAIPSILGLFMKYDTHATWATVGMLAARDKADWDRLVPLTRIQPQYKHKEFSSYLHASAAGFSEYKSHYCAPELIAQIITTPGQEVGSHTFSHYYCREEQIGDKESSEIFAEDCIALNNALAQFRITPTALVFPRNQWTAEALRIAIDHGIKTYRGNQGHFLYHARVEEHQNNLFIRALRLIDAYFNISGYNTYRVDEVNEPGADIINLPASRFFRPYSKKLFWLEWLRLHRVKRAMTHAAAHGEIFHLWWHPHNFGDNQRQNRAKLESVLKHYARLKQKYDFESLTMTEAAAKNHLTP